MAGLGDGGEQRLGVRVELGGDGHDARPGGGPRAGVRTSPPGASADSRGGPRRSRSRCRCSAPRRPGRRRPCPAGGRRPTRRRRRPTRRPRRCASMTTGGAAAQRVAVDDDGVDPVEPAVRRPVHRQHAAPAHQDVEGGGERLPAEDRRLGGERLEQVGRPARAPGERQQPERAAEGDRAEAGAVGLDRAAGQRRGPVAGRGQRLGDVVLGLGSAQLRLAPPPHLPAGAHLDRLLDRGGGVDRGDGRALGQRVQERAGAGEDEVGADRADPRLDAVLEPLLGVEQRP